MTILKCLAMRIKSGIIGMHLASTTVNMRSGGKCRKVDISLLKIHPRELY